MTLQAYDYSKLKGRIIEKHGNQGNFAKKINVSERTVSKKLNGEIQFNQKDIVLWTTALAIPNEEIPAYFFTRKVQEC